MDTLFFVKSLERHNSGRWACEIGLEKALKGVGLRPWKIPCMAYLEAVENYAHSDDSIEEEVKEALDNHSLQDFESTAEVFITIATGKSLMLESVGLLNGIPTFSGEDVKLKTLKCLYHFDGKLSNFEEL